MLHIIRGIPGAGKSTHAKEYLSNCVLHEADSYFYNGKGEYKFDRSKLKEAHAQCQEKVFYDLSQGKDVVVANTFVKLWEMKPYLCYCFDNNIAVVITELYTKYDNIHNVPADVVKIKEEQFEPLYTVMKNKPTWYECINMYVIINR